ncbi:monovalent cation/H+ antiporter subunit A [Xanthobacteraceae bacterium Astr-EGSB]|uniref:monovalent cation/H+ antiporter subunit A n=1 Tax=Astrobacterium formosum TaxID=3069710 RepID=UPI0027B5168A|nr:monovalent cation/H+ antiporter subunit A [Xanthobacteraceae bacterium Astr-EGSB]
MRIALIVLIPFIGAVIPPLAIRAGRNVCTAATAAVTGLALLLLLTDVPAVFSGRVPGLRVDWLPQAGLSFSFFIDGLGLFFAGLILVIGLLIIIYARFYLGRTDSMGRFFCYLLLFQGSMVGIVLSDNILLLVVFWELTSLSSFLLIGYWHHLPASRAGARMALIVTGAGGLALLGGMLLLGHIAGTFELSELLTRGEVVKSSPLYLPTLILILLGAFTKSAQFPFHVWLPHAMAAPTPVSAYLHSATMVKAGVFLLARLWPVLSGTPEWFLIVSATGLVTMVVAAWIALFKDDLKALLAFSTVSHLGLMTMLLGFGTPFGVIAAVFHVLNHATFKAALFMSAGIVDHEAGTRDIRRLGGLRRLMPVTSSLAIVTAASMAGVPLFNGFLSKEMMLEEAAHTVYAGQAWLFPIFATAGALLSAAYSARLVWCVFLGPKRQDYPRHPHDPPLGMWLPVAVLASAVVVIGLMPAIVAGALVERTASAAVGGALPQFHLAIWHGLTPALFMSGFALTGGLALLWAYSSLERLRLALPRPDGMTLFQGSVAGLVRSSRFVLGSLADGGLPRDLAVIVLTTAGLALAGYVQAGPGPLAGTRAALPATIPAVTGWLVLLLACGLIVRHHYDRLAALIIISVIGLVVSLAFLQFSAPDLALTQISVEIVTTILLLLALNLLPRTTPDESSTAGKLGAGALATTVGVGVAALAYAVMTRGTETISDYHIEQSKPAGGGTNVVNVILVDFRGFDTFGEIIVLSIAALTIFALLDSALHGAARRRIRTLRFLPRAGDPHPLLLTVVTRVLLPLSLVVGIYVLLRGHNMPGGGFIAGLIVAIALLMQYMASGYVWAHRRARMDAHAMIGGGVMLAGAAGLASLAFGRPFLTSTFGYFHVPLFGEIELASAMAFDIGVFFTVVGTCILSLATLSRVEERAEQASKQTQVKTGTGAP